MVYSNSEIVTAFGIYGVTCVQEIRGECINTYVNDNNSLWGFNEYKQMQSVRIACGKYKFEYTGSNLIHIQCTS